MNWAIFGNLLQLGAESIQTTGTVVDLDDIFCGTFVEESDFTDFVATMNDLIDDPSGLTAAQITILDHYEDGVVGYDDRDYWLDQLLRRNLGEQERLSWADSTPTTDAESDPLGLISGRTHVVFLDPLNSSKVYVNESSNNTCWTNEGRTIAASPSVNLFTPASTGTTYNYKVWGDVRSLAETPNSTSRRFPDITTACTVYIRGGSYTLDREISIIKQSGLVNNPSSISIRAYPGETVHIYMGNRKTSTDPAPEVYNNTSMMTISRPDLHIDGNVIFHGFRVDSNGNRIFAGSSNGVITVSNAADRFRFTCTLRDFRAIAPDHPQAGWLPHYVDYAFDYRSPATSGDSTTRMLTTTGFIVGVNNDSSVIEDATFHPAGDDIPPSVDTPGSMTEDGHGDTVDIQGATNLTIRYCVFSGTSSHSALRIVASGGVTPSGLVIEYNDMRNPENNVILISNIDSSFIRYNRIHDFANRGDLTGNDGYGIQPSDGVGNEITDNVIWIGATQGSGTNYGIAVQVSQSDATMQWTNNLIARNVLYGCGIFLGYSSGTMAVAPGRITGNTIEDNVIDGLSDYNRTQAAADGLIVTNLGPHLSNGYTNVIQTNLLFALGTGQTVVVERIHPSTYTDYKITDNGTWLLSNTYGSAQFADPDNGDFTIDFASAAESLLGANIPLHPDDLQEAFGYMCPTEFSTAVFVYTERHAHGSLNLDMPAKPLQLLGNRL